MLIAPSAGRLPGIYQVLTTANTDYRIAIPKYAVGIIFWFETSASVTTRVPGRLAVEENDTEITPIVNTDNKLGYFPDTPVQLHIGHSQKHNGDSAPATRTTHIHAACAVAGAVLRGTWLMEI